MLVRIVAVSIWDQNKFAFFFSIVVVSAVVGDGGGVAELTMKIAYQMNFPHCFLHPELSGCITTLSVCNTL